MLPPLGSSIHPFKSLLSPIGAKQVLTGGNQPRSLEHLHHICPMAQSGAAELTELDRAGQKRPPCAYEAEQALGTASAADGKGQPPCRQGIPVLKSSSWSETDLDYNLSFATCYL